MYLKFGGCFKSNNTSLFEYDETSPGNLKSAVMKSSPATHNVNGVPIGAAGRL